jgi:hypothetical protein
LNGSIVSEMAQKIIEGYVVHGPIPFKKERHIRHNSFDVTPYYAWLKFMGMHAGDIDTTMRIQQWHDRGYRIAEATLTVNIEDEEK